MSGLNKEPRRVAVEQPADEVEHMRRFIECVRSRSKETCGPMDLAFRTQAVLQMAVLSARQGRAMRFDLRKLAIL